MTQNRRDEAPRRGIDKRRSGQETAPVVPRARDVAEYLRRHPDFLCRHPDLLDVLAPPARLSGDGIADLQQIMVARLRRDLAEMTDARDELISNSRTNLQTQARVHEAVLTLLAVPSFELFVETIATDLAVILDLDVITIGVEQEESQPARAPAPGVCRLAPGTVDRVLGPGQRIVLRASAPKDPEIFGPGAGLVRSDALIRLSIGSTTPPALLAFGSRDPDHFQPGQATELLTFLARIIEQSIRGWLRLAE